MSGHDDLPLTQRDTALAGSPSPKTPSKSSSLFLKALGYPLQIVSLHPENGKVAVLQVNEASDWTDVIGRSRDLNGQGWNIYYEVNPGNREKRSKTSDISHLRAIVGDADAKEGRTVQDCMDAAAALPLPPSFTLATGGGVQVVYLLSQLAPVTKDNVELYLQTGQALRDLLDGDAVFDLPRIMRMPGFTNWPNAKKRSAGREPVKAIVSAAQDRRYNLLELSQAFVKPTKSDAAYASHIVNSDLTGGMNKDFWFDRLPPEAKNACLADMLKVPDVVALADTSDAASSPNWRTIVAACARSGAPAAYDLCQSWAKTSNRFDPSDFDARWRSYYND
jgi:hypothetical protein